GRAAADAIEHTLDALAFETPVPGHVRGVVLGIAPHAPYSAGRALYDAVTRLSQRHIYRLTTHLAESPEERQFLETASGPLVDLLKKLGKWSDGLAAQLKADDDAGHPVDWLEHALKHGRWLAAHCNYVDDDHIDILKRTGTSVVYCPLASAYLGHEKHRYRDMLDAGVNVALGTDSILCQGWGESTDQPLGILPQMRHLYRRDGADPALLLAMATVNGRRALDFNAADATLHRGGPASFTAIPIDPRDRTDPLTQALESDAPASLLRVHTTGVIEG
ncbi:MAG: amidohydrolase family protein, partial [Phycisphaeraceae bacterium]